MNLARMASSNFSVSATNALMPCATNQGYAKVSWGCMWVRALACLCASCTLVYVKNILSASPRTPKIQTQMPNTFANQPRTSKDLGHLLGTASVLIEEETELLLLHAPSTELLLLARCRRRCTLQLTWQGVLDTEKRAVEHLLLLPCA